MVTRCGNFYGGGDLNWNRIVPGTILFGFSASVGSGLSFVRMARHIRDYFYVEDARRGSVHSAGRTTGGNRDLIGHAFNFSNESQVTVLELVERILKLMHADVQPEILNQASNEIRAQYLSAAKARSMFQWEPEFTLDEGLERTIEWYRRFFEETKV
ncbi:MAG: hypothetical protein U0694_28865 [Anaerolineae bacterium]